MYQVSLQRDKSCLSVLLRGGHPVHAERCNGSTRKWPVPANQSKVCHARAVTYTARSRNVKFRVVSVMARSVVDLICTNQQIFSGLSS